jgi:energy-converting hydrogenase Eha subunit C
MHPHERKEFGARDSYEQFSDASTTPIWDLAVGLVSLVTVLGGGLAAVWAIGYLAVGRVAVALPLIGTLAVLVAIDLGLRYGRRVARRR